MESDQVWETIGRDNPYFGVLSMEKFRGKTLSPDLIDEFYDTGVQLIDQLQLRLQQLYGDFEPRELSAIDFGSGVGRLLIPMARRCRAAWGIDISSSMRNICEAAGQKAGLANVALRPSVDDIIREGGRANWLNSSVVFQHIPPEAGYMIFDKLLSVLDSPAYLSVQFTIFKDPELLPYLDKPLFVKQRGTGEYVLGGVTLAFDHFTADGMAMYDYDLDQIVALLIKHRFAHFFVDAHKMGVSNSVLIFAKRQ